GDLFITKFDPAGGLVYSTYLGGTEAEVGQGIAVDSAGSVYLTGWTRSTDFPIRNGLQLRRGQPPDAFLAKLDPPGRPAYSTCLGGSNRDDGRRIAVDAAGHAYVVGETSSDDFPVIDALQPDRARGSREQEARSIPPPDAFVAKVDVDGSRLL